MYTFVFVYTTASVSSLSNPARGPGFTGVAAHSPLVEKGNEIRRYWRLYELTCRVSNGPVLLIRHWHVSSIWYSQWVLLIAYASSIWYSIANE
jgi:hypothetical protein